MSVSTEQFLRRRLLALFGLVLAAVLVFERVEFVETESIPYRFAFEAFGPPAKGDYVRIPVQHPLIDDGKPSFLTKRIACAAGDTLHFDGRAHYCNGMEIDRINVAKLDDGQAMPVFRFDGVIPAGEIYLLGTHERSFDSRYLGLFALKDAQKVWGLF